MITSSSKSLLTAVDQPPTSAVDDDRFDLDVRIVEDGPVSAALLGSTDDGCDTVQGSDC